MAPCNHNTVKKPRLSRLYVYKQNLVYPKVMTPESNAIQGLLKLKVTRVITFSILWYACMYVCVYVYLFVCMYVLFSHSGYIKYSWQQSCLNGPSYHVLQSPLIS